MVERLSLCTVRGLRLGRICLCLTVFITSMLLGMVTVMVLREGVVAARYQQDAYLHANMAARPIVASPERLGVENEPNYPAGGGPESYTPAPEGENEEEHAYEEAEANNMRSLNSVRDGNLDKAVAPEPIESNNSENTDGKRVRIVTPEPRIKVFRQLRSFLKVPTAPASLLNANVADQKFSSAGQDEAIYKILNEKHGGFFVDIGANDGMTASNTLWLERQQGWSGLVVEADPAGCRQIDALGRNAWRLCACLSGDESKEFARQSAGMVDPRKVPRGMRSVQTPCFQFEEAMTTLDVDHVDYLSISGSNAVPVLEDMRDYLKSGRVTVDAFSIRYRAEDNNAQKTYDTLIAIRHYFLTVGGYTEWGRLSRDHQFDDAGGEDVIFVRNGVMKS